MPTRVEQAGSGRVSSINQASQNAGLTLRQAALIAGFAYLLSPVTTAEFSIMPKLVIAGNIEQTVQNISAIAGRSLPQFFATWLPFSRTW
jgi:hypothetical protein